MLIEHRGAVPEIDPTAYIAPTAVICGAVRIGPGARVLFGAVLTAEDGQVSLGARSIVMENAVIRGRARHPTVIGDDVLVGPHAHVNGARVDLDFPGTVHGVSRDTPANERMSRQSAWFAAHLDDRVIDDDRVTDDHDSQ